MDAIIKDEYWMQYALALAQWAEIKGEVPVGSVLILNNTKIAQGWNSSINQNDPTAHAEIIALRKGGKFINNYRLLNTTLYVTLEPCLMCLGAILNSRVERLVYGAQDTKDQKLKFWGNIIKKKRLKVKQKVLNKECTELIQSFFQRKRMFPNSVHKV
ncbi:tRNA adenosine(34) deaminase TadA [Buchnera aphidicola (Hormaphis cornu)]|nr:tRNA adenosine(34) deaminase TadA [Buchnera aphidicola (Hormaphis cornu)]